MLKAGNDNHANLCRPQMDRVLIIELVLNNFSHPNCLGVFLIDGHVMQVDVLQRLL
jgi:hypothetical protein